MDVMLFAIFIAAIVCCLNDCCVYGWNCAYSGQSLWHMNVECVVYCFDDICFNHHSFFIQCMHLNWTQFRFECMREYYFAHSPFWMCQIRVNFFIQIVQQSFVWLHSNNFFLLYRRLWFECSSIHKTSTARCSMLKYILTWTNKI